MLNYLILFAVNRGAIATILQVLYLVTFVAWPTSLIWGVFHTLVVKLSTNSVLAALNSRIAIRNVGTDVELMNLTEDLALRGEMTTDQAQTRYNYNLSSQIAMRKETIRSADMPETGGPRVLQIVETDHEDKSIFHPVWHESANATKISMTTPRLSI